MKVNVVSTCLLIYCSLIYRNNVVECSDTLSSSDPDSDGSTPETTPQANLSGLSASSDDNNGGGTPLTGGGTTPEQGSSGTHLTGGGSHTGSGGSDGCTTPSQGSSGTPLTGDSTNTGTGGGSHTRNGDSSHTGSGGSTHTGSGGSTHTGSGGCTHTGGGGGSTHTGGGGGSTHTGGGDGSNQSSSVFRKKFGSGAVYTIWDCKDVPSTDIKVDSTVPTKPDTAPNDSCLKLISDDPNDSTKQLEIVKSNVTVKVHESLKDSYFYDLKDAKCVIVKYNDQQLWKKGDYSIDNPKYISLSTKSDIRLVICDDKRLATFHWGSDGVWTHFRTQTAVTSPSDIKFYTGDPTDPEDMTELDASTYDYTYCMCAAKYTFKDDVRCTMITCAGHKVWRTGELGVVHPRSVIYFKFSGMIKLTIGKNDVRTLMYKAGKWECSQKDIVDTSALPNVMKLLPESEYPNDIKLFGYDKFNRALELGKDVFTLKQYPDVKDEFLYEFYSGTKCSQVMFSDHVLWSRGDNQVVKPISLNYNKKQNQIVVFDSTKGIIYDRGGDGTWKFTCTITYSSQDSVIGRLKQPDIVKQAVGTGQQTAESTDSQQGTLQDNAYLIFYDTHRTKYRPAVVSSFIAVPGACPSGRDAG